MKYYAAALSVIGGLSNPSKMPCYSYSIPAERCQLGSKLRRIAGSACGHCYALKGCYVFPSTRAAMVRRMSIVDAMLADPVRATEWVESFAAVLNELHARTDKLIHRTGAPGARDGRFFRWHDSGDLQSISHLAAIVAVCEATPEVRHWLPTREVGVVRAYLATGAQLPPNLRVRLSTPRIDAAPSGLLATLGLPLSGIHTETPIGEGARSCIAYRQDGACRDCRACWGAAPLISYPLH